MNKYIIDKISFQCRACFGGCDFLILYMADVMTSINDKHNSKKIQVSYHVY